MLIILIDAYIFYCTKGKGALFMFSLPATCFHPVGTFLAESYFNVISQSILEMSQ
jgi:hypothetical protein